MPSPPPFQGVRVRLIYTQGDGSFAGNRFYLSYSGSAPTPANCVTLAGDVATAWAAHIAGLVGPGSGLTEVDVLDLASSSGASGQWTGAEGAGRTGTGIPYNCATNVEFNIARRYRGGKPRMFLPPPTAADLTDEGHWTLAFISASNTGVAAFFSALEALSIGSMGTLAHVNVSFFHGKATTTPPWRGPGYKYPPAYRASALVDAVEGYATKAEVGSQRRRRTATTP